MSGMDTPTMFEFLQDPRTWAPAATSVAIVVTIILFLINYRRKQLSYEVVSNTPLVGVKEDIAGKLQILYDGKPVADANLVVVRVINTGNVPIKSADFEGRLSVWFDPASEILMAEVAETRPGNLEYRSTSGKEAQPLISQVDNNEVVLRPILLNPRDYITLKMLVGKVTGRVALVGHIEGIHEIKELKDSIVLPLVLGNAGALVMFLAILLLNPENLFHLKFAEILPFLIAFVMGYALVFIGLYLPRRSRAAAQRALEGLSARGKAGS